MQLSASSARDSLSASSASLSTRQLVEIYRLMYLSRRVDDREILLKRQQKIFFQISAAGHEALQVALPGPPSRLRLVLPLLSRSRALPGARRHARRHVAAGRGRGHRSGQRRPPDAHPLEQPPAPHRQHLLLHHHATASCRRMRRGRPLFQPPSPSRRKARGDYRAFHDVEFHGDEVVFTSLGEGSTSQGEFWEALNTASNQKLPVIFCVEDNGYAISVPVEVNTPGGNISRLVANFPNFYFAEIDGTDPEACLRAFQTAAAHCRAGLGPAFVHGHVVRPYSHRILRRRQALPLRRRARSRRHARSPRQMQMRLLREGILTDSEINALEQSLDHEAAEAAERALEAPLPKVADITRHVYSEDLDPTRADFATEQFRSRQQDRVFPAAAMPAAPREAVRAPWPTSSTPAFTTRCAAIPASSSMAKT
jgi:2-oxoisovalerate dehydrogenase E1 component